MRGQRRAGRAGQARSGQGATSPLLDLLWGLERETHRILPDGHLSPAPHPAALAPPAFTRDFAESQLEIVTQPQPTADDALAQLESLTIVALREVARHGELLWPLSMPPGLGHADEVQIADFGPGETERRARQYREGLALRYGKARQAICGVHLNVSAGPRLTAWLGTQAPLTDEEGRTGRAADGYHLRLARRLYADLPLLVLLTGASPVRGGEADAPALPVLSQRSGAHGYGGSEFQPYLDLASLGAYMGGIRRGLRTESGAFARLGLVRNGRIVQLNAMVFQSEKELYAPIRLRQAVARGETTLAALERRGIGYLELRFLDVDPFQPAGIAGETLRLVHLLMLDGLTRPSLPRPTATLRQDLAATAAVALSNPLDLADAASGACRELLTAAAGRLAALRPWAERLDAAAGGPAYRASLTSFERRVRRPRRLPASLLIRDLQASGLDWTSFGMRVAERHHASLVQRRESEARESRSGAQHALDHAGL